MRNFNKLLWNTAMGGIILGGGFLSVSSAQAQTAWDIRIGGYYNATVAYSSVDGPGTDDFDGVESIDNAEFQLQPSITLDNGIRLAVNIQLESDNDGTGDYIDEGFVSITGSFGTVLLGDTDSAGLRMIYGSPSPDYSLIDGFDDYDYQLYTGLLPVEGFRDTGSGFVGFGNDFRSTLGTTYIENDGDGEASRISYFTPRFSGVQVGISFARDDGSFDRNRTSDCNTQTCNFFDVGVNYVNSFDGFDVAISGRWGVADAPPSATEDPNIAGFGINLDYGNIEIEARYAEQNGTRFSDGKAYEIGGQYQAGKMTYALNYKHGENVDNELAFVGSGGENEQIDTIIASLTYPLAGNGILMSVFGAHVDFDEDFSDNGMGSGDDMSGFVIASSIQIGF